MRRFSSWVRRSLSTTAREFNPPERTICLAGGIVTAAYGLSQDGSTSFSACEALCKPCECRRSYDNPAPGVKTREHKLTGLSFPATRSLKACSTVSVTSVSSTLPSPSPVSAV